MPRSTPLTLALLLTGAAFAPAPVLAHPAVDEGRRLYEEAEFEAAAAALDRAERDDDLTRPELVELLELRMLLHAATDDADGLRTDVQRLLSLDPSYDPGAEVPPEVGAVFERVRAEQGGAVAIRARAAENARGVRVDAEVDNDPAQLTREVRVVTQSGDEPPSIASPPVHLALGDVTQLRYYAEAIGPGGVVIARHGSDRDPLVIDLGGSVTQPGGEDVTPWIVTGVVAGVLLVAGAVVLGVLLGTDAAGGQSDVTRPSVPMVVLD